MAQILNSDGIILWSQKNAPVATYIDKLSGYETQFPEEKFYLKFNEDDKQLRIFHQDHGWRGNIVVAAYDEVSARKLMENIQNYEAGKPVTGFEIVEGLTFFNLGDM